MRKPIVIGILGLLGACTAAPAPRKAAEPAAPDASSCLVFPRRDAPLPTGAPRNFARAEAELQDGLRQAEAGDQEAARAAFERAVGADSSHGFAHLELALAHLFTDNDRAAMRKHTAQAAQLLPRNPRAHLAYAETVAEDGDIEAAIRHFGCALELRSDLTEAHFHLGRLYFRTGNLDDAEQHMRLAVHEGASPVPHHVLLGDVLEARGEVLAAADRIATAARLAGRSAALFRRAGALYEAGQDLTSANAMRVAADALDPPLEDRDLRPLRKAREGKGKRKKR